jgi:hypothetical protein
MKKAVFPENMDRKPILRRTSPGKILPPTRNLLDSSGFLNSISNYFRFPKSLSIQISRNTFCVFRYNWNRFFPKNNTRSCTTQKLMWMPVIVPLSKVVAKLNQMSISSNDRYFFQPFVFQGFDDTSRHSDTSMFSKYYLIGVKMTDDYHRLVPVCN